MVKGQVVGHGYSLVFSRVVFKSNISVPIFKLLLLGFVISVAIILL